MLALALALLLAFAAPSSSVASTLPAQGILVPGKSLAGVRLGDTQASVLARWGKTYRVCTGCSGQTWLFTYPKDEPIGAAVTFRKGKAAVVFTLGSPLGWRTREGLRVGGYVDRAQSLYGAMSWKVCVGYAALSMRHPNAVTSIYATGEIVYGFALTRPSEPVCQ